jgi:peptidoglycan/xylan/chitin deacetylase (PgdA/CDA1 family)
VVVIALILAGALAAGTIRAFALQRTASTAGLPGSGNQVVAAPSERPSASSLESLDQGSPEPSASAAPSPSPSPKATAGPSAKVGWHVPILMYHLVATPAEAGNSLPSLVVSPTLFAAQMQKLRLAGWHTVTASTLAADLSSGHRPPRQTFVVTLDDGHEDGYTEAFPILKANGFVATYYDVTGRVDRAGWLSSNELVAMDDAGMEIADHTVNHTGLTTVSNAVAISEIVGAKTFIANLLGSPPTTLAYPYGSWNAAVVADVRAAGFLLALTTKEGCFESTSTRLQAPRLRVSPSTTPVGLLAAVRACGYP